MNVKRKYQPKADPRTFEYPLDNGTLFSDVLIKGTEVGLRGKQGRFRFQYATETSGGQTVLTFVGGPLHGQNDEFVSAYPSRVTRIFKANKTLVNIQKDKNNGN